MGDGDGTTALASPGSLRPDDVGSPVIDGASEEDLRDQLDALRARIQSGGLSSVEQRALSADAWSTVAAQLRVMLGQGPGRPDGDVPPLAPGRVWW